MRHLIYIFGDQLNINLSSLEGFDPQKDCILMAEVVNEATYVKHHKQKIALIFSAMRHFRLELEALGHSVHYVTIDQGVSSLEAAVRGIVEHSAVSQVIVCEPGEYRLLDQMRAL